MAIKDLNDLRAQVNADITTNGVRAITGSILNTQLIDIIDSVESDYTGLNDALDVRVTDVEDALDSAAFMILQDPTTGFDASGGVFPGGGVARAGFYWIVSTAGTIDGITFDDGDAILALVNNASTTVYAGNWEKRDDIDKTLKTINSQTLLGAGDVDVRGDFRATALYNGQKLIQNKPIFFPAINFLDGNAVPPAAFTNDIYVLVDLGNGAVNGGWDGANYNDWVINDGTVWRSQTPPNGATCYDKTASVNKRFNGSTWVEEGSASGKVAIYDANGNPTFYSTVILAMAAAVSGDVIQLFANLTEAVFPLILKDGVTVNGNGFTYAYTSTDAAIRSETVSTSYLKNIIVRATDSSCPRAVQAFTSGGIINISDDCFIFGAQRALEVAVGATVNGGNYISSHATLYAVESSGNVSKLKIKSNRCGNILAGTIRDCYADAGNLGFVLSSGVVAYNLLGICAGSYGIYANAARVFNSNGFSSGNAGIYGEGGAEFQGCNAYSTGYYGWEGVNQTLINCSSYSTVNRAFSGGGNIRKSEFTALLAQAVFLSSGFIRKSDINCMWNNAGGYGVNLNANNLKVVGNYIQVANASANCVTGGVFNAVLAHNEYEGATTDENANLTNIANTENTFGNIKI